MGEFELENINGWDNEDDIPEKHKLVDPLLESTLNEYGVVTRHCCLGNNRGKLINATDP